VKHLVDANVLSEATKPDPNPRVVEWLRRNERSIVVDPIVLGEVRLGILLLARGARRAELEQWLLVYQLFGPISMCSMAALGTRPSRFPTPELQTEGNWFPEPANPNH
jgi:predicted nucleic acid-binding protein